MKGSFGQLTAVGFEEVAQKLYDQAFEAVARGFEEDIVPVVGAAEIVWPVDTGESRGSLFVGVTMQDATSMTLEMGNRADYSGVIHDGQTAENLLFRPVRVAARRAAITIARNAVGSR